MTKCIHVHWPFLLCTLYVWPTSTLSSTGTKYSKTKYVHHVSRLFLVDFNCLCFRKVQSTPIEIDKLSTNKVNYTCTSYLEVCVCMCVCACMRSRMCVCLCVCACTYVCACMCMSVRICVYMHVCAIVCVCMHGICMSECMHVCGTSMYLSGV